MSTRRIIMLAVAVLVVIVGIVVYLFLRPNPAAPTTGGQTGTLPGAIGGAGINGGGNLSNASGTGNILSLIDQGPVLAYFAGTNSSTAASNVIVVRPNGAILTITNGQTVSLSSSSIQNLFAASFSHDGAKIVLSSGNIDDPQVSIFDVPTRSWTQLGMGILSPAWSPNDYRLAYLRNGASSEALTVVDVSKVRLSPTALGTFSLQDMQLTWPSLYQIVLSSRPSAYADGSILVFNIQQKTLSPTITLHAGLTAIWNSSPLMGLAFSSGAGRRGGFAQFIDSAGSVLQNLSFITLPSKCVFAEGMTAVSSTVGTLSASSTNKKATSTPPTAQYQFVPYLYCGIPRDQGGLAYAVLPDAYAQHSLFTSDDMYKINVATGNAVPLFTDPSQSFDVTGASVVGNKFYFVSRYDLKLYAITMAQ